MNKDLPISDFHSLWSSYIPLPLLCFLLRAPFEYFDLLIPLFEQHGQTPLACYKTYILPYTIIVFWRVLQTSHPAEVKGSAEIVKYPTYVCIWRSVHKTIYNLTLLIIYLTLIYRVWKRTLVQDIFSFANTRKFINPGLETF